MRRLIFAIFTFAVLFTGGSAVAAEPEELKMSVDFNVGYRTDKLDWSIAGDLTPGVFVDPVSELDWSNIDIAYSKASIRMSYKKFYARGSLGYGRILAGEVRDSDWAASGRQSEWSRAMAKTDGYVFDSTLGFGYQIDTGNVSIIPLVGYSWHLQFLEVNDGTQVICNTIIDPTCTTGHIAGLNTTYEPRWQGPWLGLDFSVTPSDKTRFFTTIEYHIGDYRANAYWNLRDLRFEHIADAEGFVISAGFTYKVKDTWDVGLETQYSKWKSDTGVDRTFGASGIALLNEVTWESIYIMLNITHRFYELYQTKRLHNY